MRFGVFVQTLLRCRKFWVKDDGFLPVTEGDVKMSKDIFSAKKIKTYSESIGKSDGSFEGYVTDFDIKFMKVDRNRTAISDSNKHFSAFFGNDINSNRVLERKDGNESSGIDVGFNPGPYFRPFNCEFNYWTRSIPEDFIGENYRAHRKSSGRGTGIPIGIVPGYFLRASFCRSLGPLPEKTSPPETTMYLPAYWLTNSSKWIRIHSSLSAIVHFFVFVFILITSDNFIL